MSEATHDELASRYQPSAVEGPLYEKWEASGAFCADVESSAESFAIAIPPPNVTGVLHMGHALNNTIQDIIIRFQRMNGRAALWLPGTDHAGIATQAVVEKRLFKEKGQTREDLGREKFLAEVWAWKEEHGNQILEQLRRMGCSCDWSRTAFTMDAELSRAVREAFVRLWEKDLIYRGARLVNWDCRLQTAVSDDEIEHVERKTKLWYLRYPVEGDPSRHLVVATTRPETMLGDTGVAVHPEDERYADLVGKNLTLPLMNRPIPVVADDTVQREFGTGAVKVTPGHDPNDYERGKRFQLPVINLINADGTLNDQCGPYEGMKLEPARNKVVEDLDALGLLEKIEDHEHAVAISDRSGTVIEPLVSEQWFVQMEPLARPAIKAAKDGTLKFVPERWKKVYLDWLENVRDWCISRQLWWGHRIPVWYDEDDVPVACREDLEIGSEHPRTGKPIVRQDPDVLDTWASSWLWPFATLGWPERTPDLDKFYPTQFLSTARDIIYLWVARMVMAGYEFVDHLPVEERCPFSTCYIHATVLDSKGRRMSKSLGNGIDPLELVDEYGADATRMALTLLTVEGQDIRFSEHRVEEARNFVNKLWNAARFVLTRVPDEPLDDVDLGQAERLEDRWILQRVRTLTEQVKDSLDHCRFHDAAQSLRRFVWNEFCDWYLEIVKVRFDDSEEAKSRQMARAVTVNVLQQVLHLLHPVTPFVTEALWEHVRARRWWAEPGAELLLAADWPDAQRFPEDTGAADTMAAFQDLVSSLRNLRARNAVPDRKVIDASVRLPSAALVAALEEAKGWFERLSRTRLLGFSTAEERPEDSDADVISMTGFGTGEVYLPLGDLIDKEARAQDLEKKLTKLEGHLRGLESKLANEGFVSRAPEAVVQAERDRLESLKSEQAGLQAALRDLRG